MFQSRKQKLNGYIEELSEYECVLCDHTGKVYDNEKARKDVEHFFKQFICLSPHRKYEVGRMENHYSYFGTFLKMKLNLINKEYPEFCHELITLNHYENLLQKRIYYNIVELYNNYFEVKNEPNKKNIEEVRKK